MQKSGASNGDRCVRLRRPATLQVIDGTFVPDGPPGLLDEVDRRWSALVARNPRYHDGRLRHVLGVHRNGCGGAVLHVVECAYRFHAVQDAAFDLGVRALGVKGVVERDGRLLFGRRAAHVAADGGHWELAPGGVAEPGEAPATTVARELREETTLNAAREPIAVALLYDSALRCWEIVHTIDAIGAVPPATDEYDALAWHPRDEPPEPLTRIARAILRL